MKTQPFNCKNAENFFHETPSKPGLIPDVLKLFTVRI